MPAPSRAVDRGGRSSVPLPLPGHPPQRRAQPAVRAHVVQVLGGIVAAVVDLDDLQAGHDRPGVLPIPLRERRTVLVGPGRVPALARLLDQPRGRLPIRRPDSRRRGRPPSISPASPRCHRSSRTSAIRAANRSRSASVSGSGGSVFSEAANRWASGPSAGWFTDSVYIFTTIETVWSYYMAVTATGEDRTRAAEWPAAGERGGVS